MNAVFEFIIFSCHHERNHNAIDNFRALFGSRQILQNPASIYPGLLHLRASDSRWDMAAWAKVIFDCTWPLEWGGAVPERVSFNEMYPEDIKQRVIQNWTRYGFD